MHSKCKIATHAFPLPPPHPRADAPRSLWQSFLRGGYPELVAQPERNLQLWHASYIQTYVERDVRTLRQVGDLTQFQSFLRMIAARSGQLLNLSDVGTLCYLSGLRDAEHAAAGPLGGAIFETAVLSQIVRTLAHRGEEPRVYFWRTAAGAEVDFIVETGGRLVPIEVKLSGTPRPPMAAAIRTFQEDVGAPVGAGYVVHPGDVRLPLGPRVMALPFADL